MKRYIFCRNKYPLGQIQYDEKEGTCNFDYFYSSGAEEFTGVKPETTIAVLEQVRHDAKEIETVRQFIKYVKMFNVENFYFVPMIGYE